MGTSWHCLRALKRPCDEVSRRAGESEALPGTLTGPVLAVPSRSHFHRTAKACEQRSEREEAENSELKIVFNAFLLDHVIGDVGVGRLELVEAFFAVRFGLPDLVGRRVHRLQKNDAIVVYRLDLHLRRLLDAEGRKPPFHLALQGIEIKHLHRRRSEQQDDPDQFAELIKSEPHRFPRGWYWVTSDAITKSLPPNVILAKGGLLPIVFRGLQLS